MFSRSSILLCFFFLLASLGSLILKVHVQNLAMDIKDIERQRNELTNEIQVLKAEWSYLNNPERLSKLAKQYLGLKRTKIKQIKYINNDKTQAVDNMKHIKHINTNWRYKSRTSILKVSSQN